MLGTTIAHYQITDKIGQGGMGEVYRASDTKLDREVAIKVLPEGFANDPERLSRFEREAKTLAALNHPNIMVIHDVGLHERIPYLVTELLEGRTLRDALKGGSLSSSRTMDYTQQVAHGMAAAHGKGIIHRDLKPENLFVTKDGQIKVLDFGLAKLNAPPKEDSLTESEASTQPGRVLGTPAYMSPEQVRGEPADARSDIFSFGCVGFEMLTGGRAFGRDTPVETMNAVLNDEPLDLDKISPDISPPLARVVRRCLEKEPESRFQSAKDLAFAIESASFPSTSVPSVRGAHTGSGLNWGRALPWAVASAIALAWAVFFLLDIRGNRETADVPLLVSRHVEHLPASALLGLGTDVPPIGIQ